MYEFITLTKSNIRTFEHLKANANVINFKSCWKPKNKHVRHEFFDRRKIANNLTQRVRTEFPYKRLSCLYDEMEPSTRRNPDSLIRTRKRI